MIPKRIHSDSGLEFNNQTYKDFAKTNNFHCTYSAIAHPQSNGSVERFHATLLDSLRCYHHDYSRDKILNGLSFAIQSYNNSKSQSTKFTPQELIFGHIRNDSELVNLETGQEMFIRDRQNLVSYQYPQVIQNQQNAKEKSKIHFDKHVHANKSQYKENQLVYLRESKIGNKMKNKYNSPFKIIRLSGHNSAEIRLPANRTSIVNYDRLKPFYENNQQKSKSSNLPGSSLEQ